MESGERECVDDQVLLVMLELGALYFLTFISVIYCCVNAVSFETAQFLEPGIVYMISKSTILWRKALWLDFSLDTEYY